MNLVDGRGAKVAMTVALRSSSLLGALIPVDNAPVDALLKSDFSRYLEGMREIEYTGVRKTAEADHILRKYEDVRVLTRAESGCLGLTLEL